jgi:hypothetical protein
MRDRPCGQRVVSWFCSAQEQSEGSHIRQPDALWDFLFIEVMQKLLKPCGNRLEKATPGLFYQAALPGCSTRLTALHTTSEQIMTSLPFLSGLHMKKRDRSRLFDSWRISESTTIQLADTLQFFRTSLSGNYRIITDRP